MAGMEQILAGAGNVRTPVDWFADRLRALRAEVGQIPAMLYSDGDDGALAPILAEPDVARSERPAITGLLEMTSAAAIIGSGSGFSILASLLGGVPRMSHPGQRLAFARQQRGADIESGAGEALPGAFLGAIEARPSPPAARAA